MSLSRLTIAGCGDAFCSGGRLNTCFFVQTPETSFLLDFGATSLAALKLQGVDVNSVPLIFITHLHGDHVGGLPFYLLEASLVNKRSAPLTIAGPPGLREHLPKLTEALFPGTPLELPFELEVLELAPDQTHEVQGLEVTPMLVKHAPTLVCTGLRFAFNGKVLAYSGDSVWTPSLPLLAQGADIFICDAYTAEISTAQHLSYQELLAHKDELNCKELVITHLGQAFLDALASGLNVAYTVAQEGLELTF